MSTNDSRFTPQNKTTQERLSSNTVGLVAFSDFRKRRAEVIEQQEREAREAAATGSSGTPIATPDRSLSGTPDPNANDASSAARKRAKKRRVGAAKLSFVDDDDDDTDAGKSEDACGSGKEDGKDIAAGGQKNKKIKANTSIAFVPRATTKSVLMREAAEREQLRKEFLLKQEAVKAAEIAVPFVFYDGTNIPGGTVRIKKGDFIWVFLDKSRKVGAELGVGEKANARREWARVGVDDLMLVRGNVIIPHHYEFLFFMLNKTIGPNNKQLFDYSADPPTPKKSDTEDAPINPLTTAAALKTMLPDIDTLEGASDDPTFTKVVDRRWYERNKHIFPASVWQDFDPEKDYQSEVRRDLGGNSFFYT